MRWSVRVLSVKNVVENATHEAPLAEHASVVHVDHVLAIAFVVGRIHRTPVGARTACTAEFLRNEVLRLFLCAHGVASTIMGAHLEQRLAILLVHGITSPQRQLQNSERRHSPADCCTNEMHNLECPTHKSPTTRKLTIKRPRVLHPIVLQRLILDNLVHQNRDHHQRRYHAPADAPIPARLDAQHKLRIAANPTDPIDPAERDQLGDGQHIDHHRHTKVVHQIQQKLSALRRVQQTNAKLHHCNGNGHPCMAQPSEFVPNRSHQTDGHAHVAADGQHKQHEEERGGEQLRHKLHLGDGVRVGDERNAGAAFHHRADVCRARFVRQIAENAKDDYAGDQRRERVQRGQDESVPVRESFAW